MTFGFEWLWVDEAAYPQGTLLNPHASSTSHPDFCALLLEQPDPAAPVRL